MLIGIWPFKFDHKSRLLRISYEIYCKLLHAYYYAALYCQCVQIYFLEEYNVDEVLENVGVTMLYTINLVKVAICSSKGAKDLMFQIFETEKRIFAGKQQTHFSDNLHGKAVQDKNDNICLNMKTIRNGLLSDRLTFSVVLDSILQHIVFVVQAYFLNLCNLRTGYFEKLGLITQYSNAFIF